MLEFILTGLLGIALISICSLNIYESLRFVWKRLPSLTWSPRMHILGVVWLLFFSHIMNIWLFGIVYYLLHFFDLGTFGGAAVEHGRYTLDFFGCLYFSAVIYSTLGLGDITPEGALRMVTGVEALAGFVLIGWTVSFTYLAMQKFWELPHHKHERPRS